MNKIKNVTREVIRQIKLNLDWEHLKWSWDHFGTNEFTGMKERRVFDTKHRLVGTVKRDRLDQIIDFIDDKITNLKRGIREECCTHPEDKCYLSIDGDTYYGFVKRYSCERCGSYLNEDSLVDRYTGGTKMVKEVCTYPLHIPEGYEDYTGEKFVKP